MSNIQQIYSNKPFAKVIAFTTIIIIAFWIASFFPDLVLTLIISLIISFILKPIVNLLEFKYNIKRSIAIGIIFLIIIGITTITLIETATFLVNRFKFMYEQFRQFPFEEKLTLTAQQLTINLPFVDSNAIAEKVHTLVNRLVQSAGETAGAILSYLVNLLIIPFISYFILAEGDQATKKLIKKIPNKYFEMSLNIIYKVKNELIFYIRGLILESCIIGGISIIGFIIIGVPYATFLGILTGIANLIPYLGPVIGALLAILASLTKTGDFQMALPIMIFFIGTRIFDDLFIKPRCFGKSLKIHPVAVVIILIIGFQLMGISGMIIAIPIATILYVTAKEAYWGLKNYSITM